ncbi:hypothetical protein [Celeribacter marinus]|uniref:Uncharacterized protein n=1 Tax=Celeribacter marinus TaxID=1397108 RepID=A0A0P0ADB2_9RHOB|nr:hypothetical protein [Celeribacter marinus]ALI56906.1 hypothetical protein IMCC12053_2959 [Celeribacter marinus]SFK67827.1 hypothetical protein SAMN05444421_10715 [Celeribacter marinus]
MRILAGVLALTVLAGCQMELPAFNAVRSTPDELTVAAMVSDATGSQVLVDAPSDYDLAQTQDLSTAFEDAATPVSPRKGLFAFLKPAPVASPLDGTDIEVIDAQVAQGAQDAAVARGNGGIFAFLKPKPQDAQPAITGIDAEDATDNVELAALALEPADEGGSDIRPETVGVSPNVEPAPKKNGLFGGLFANARSTGSGAARSTVQPGEVVAFGTVGVACEAKPAAQAKLVDKFPREGRAVWKLYDTDVSSTQARTQFITGFDDNCPRQITASLVMFGSAALHEVHRYSKARKKAPWSLADKEYEVIKSKTCGVGKGVNCPAQNLPKLESHMAFVSVYETFGGTGAWLELLVSDGKLISDEVR